MNILFLLVSKKKTERKIKKLTYRTNNGFAIVWSIWTRFRERYPFFRHSTQVITIYECIIKLVSKRNKRYIQKTYLLCSKWRWNRCLVPPSWALPIFPLHFVHKTYIWKYYLVSIEKDKKKILKTYILNKCWFSHRLDPFRCECRPFLRHSTQAIPIYEWFIELILKKNERNNKKKLTYRPNKGFPIVCTRLRERHSFFCYILYLRLIYECIIS
jgi:hypothetical protein